ncbi:uncharacterized protein LOC113380647 [Ctenocephalides felis]|uniref:uncharacterized protein LOC113380647 n=1 Tax=Ctenocephalides felis TaxID=7515 RepID=UPI000E6E4C77|nr:uncharacterized protein LOC113380647 [Ctenocephalides felis]
MSTPPSFSNDETALNRSLIDLNHEAIFNTSSPRVSEHDSYADQYNIAAFNNHRLTPFNGDSPDLWFLVIEYEFQSAKIRSDDTKYTAVHKALDFETLRLIQDVLRNPPMTGKYEHIKTTILSRTSESRDKQIVKLFKNLTLGEKKPSQLLREMMDLAKEEVSEDIIIKLWSERLPHHIQPQLIVSRHLGPEALAEVADILVDHCSPTSHVMSSTRKSSVEQRLDHHETLLMSCVKEVKELRAMLNTERQKNDQQESQHNRSRPRSGQHNQSRSRSGSRHSSRTPSRGSVCYYHYRYGEKATKCEEPCLLKSLNGSENLLHRH